MEIEYEEKDWRQSLASLSVERGFKVKNGGSYIVKFPLADISTGDPNILREKADAYYEEEKKKFLEKES